METRDRLLDAAEKLFAAKGYDGTSIGDVAAEAGIGVGTVYHHFADKRALFLALLDDFPARRKAKGALGGDGGSFAAILDEQDKRAALASALWTAHLRRKNAPDAVAVAWNVARRDPEVAERCRAIQAYQVGITIEDLRTGQQRGVIRPDVDAETSALLLHDLYMCVMGRLSSPPVPSEEDARRLVDALATLLYRYLMTE